MYAVKVEEAAGSSGDLLAQSELRPSSSGPRAEEVAELPETAVTPNAISVSAGNPRVEHLTGVVHLYRCLPAQAGVLAQQTSDEAALESPTCSLPDSADTFYLSKNSKPFTSLEPNERCHLVFVKDVQISDSQSPVGLPIPGQRELPTCPVCLERLDENASGIVTTVCNHEFHNECLQRWGDTSCPVCRYVANEAPSASRCSHCGTAQDLWICLICGHVGCGRYREGHAVDHWHESGHAYALELESQRVWDYVSDGYVHRLVQSKTDGKLVEVPSPAQTSARRQSHDRSRTADEQAECREAGAEGSEAGLSTKLDAITIEYNHLLVSQLDSQRAYFEGMLSKQAAAHELAMAEALTDQGQAQASLRDQSSAVHLAEQARRAAEKRAADSLSKAQKAQKEVQDLRSLTEQVMRNQATLKQAKEVAETGTAAAEMRIKDLEEQVRDLMVFIEAQRTIAEAGELQAGSASVPAPAAGPARKSRSGKRK